MGTADGVDRGKRPWPAWRRARLRVWLPRVAYAVLLVIAIAILGEEVHRHTVAIEAWIAGLGVWSFLVFAALFVVLTSVFVPDTALAITAGALFGLARGVAVIWIGGVLAAAAQYALSRRLLKRRIDGMLAARPRLAAIEQAVKQQEFRLQLLVRLTPLSPTLTSYVLGAAGVRFSWFTLSCLGLFPALAVEVYFGYIGRHVARMAGRNQQSVLLHDAVTFGGLLIGIVAMAAIAKMARHAVEEATAAAATPTAPAMGSAAAVSSGEGGK